MFWVVSSVDTSERRNKSRSWAYWESLEDALDYVVKGWSDAEFFYESGYYTHVVVESHMLNHPLSIDVKDRRIFWFKLVETKSGKIEAVKCRTPKKFKNVIGFN